MTNDEQGRDRKRWRLWLVLGLAVLLLAVAIVPPMLSVSGYKSRITQLMSASLGRPVRLSSIKLRLLPRPGFVLTDLTVEEDPAYGAEPVLHASTVTASIRLLSLWRGRMEISRISVDEASLNLVRTADGRWNLETLFGTAAAQSQGGTGLIAKGRKVPLPYLEATNSRINVKDGVEKLPFSLIATDVSFWQDEPGDWRIRLRGQPARTDVSVDMADTGIVRLEATLRKAAGLREMPVKLDLEWKEAQLGQLSRLVIGSDPGWRGALTGEVHLEGTAESAQVKTRLTATGVHRAEFAPAVPMDFDANCGFTYHYPSRAMENLVCDSPLGDGHIRVAGEMPGGGASPKISVELDKISVAAGLDALRTVRSGFGPGLEAKGLVSGKISYAEAAPEDAATEKTARFKGGVAQRHEGKNGTKRAQATSVPTAGPLTGSLTVDGFQLSGDGLQEPITVQKLVLVPVMSADLQKPKSGQPVKAGPPQAPGSQLPGVPALVATMAVPAGGTSPLAVTTRLAISGYQVTVKGQASMVRARELAHLASMANSSALDALTGDPVSVDITAEGPWSPPAPSLPTSGGGSTPLPPCFYRGSTPSADTLTGTVSLRNANWKANYLANPIEISQATLHLDPVVDSWAPVVFSYGPVKGTAFLNLPASFDASPSCQPEFHLLFGSLDAGALQAAVLGAHERGTLVSELIARFSPAATPAWPQLGGTVRADSLVLGPVTLRDATASLRVLPSGAEIVSLEASLLGGKLHGTGTFHAAGSGQDKPSYTLESHLERLSPEAVGQLLGQHWSGGTMDANGKVALSGFTDKDLTSSAAGTLHFEWRRGMVAGKTDGPVPGVLSRFDRWKADVAIGNGAMKLGDNEVQVGTRKTSVAGSANFGIPAKPVFVLPKTERTASR
jgi:hypothetical protein